MDKQAIIEQVRDLIADGKTEKALDTLLEYVEQATGNDRTWADTVRALASRFSQAKRERGTLLTNEGFGIEQNKVVLKAQDVLNSLASNLPAPSATAPVGGTANGNQRKAILYGGITVGILLLTTVLWLLLRPSTNTNGDDTDTDVTDTTALVNCPVYPVASKLNVMLLPYKPLRGDREQVESVLKDRLARQIEEYGIPASVFTKDIEFDSNIYPSTGTDAIAVGKPCKAQLIIWGTTEQIATGVITTTNFKFVDNETFSTIGYSFNENAEIDTISSLSSIATTGQLTENIERSIQLIFGLIARETDRHDIASEILEEETQARGGAAENPKWAALTADSYVQSGHPDKALEMYNSLVESDPKNPEYREKRGTLLLSMGKTQDALVDFNTGIAANPEHADLRIARAAANIQMHDVHSAEQDLNAAAQDRATTPQVNKLRTGVERVRVEEEAKKARAESTLRQNPNDAQALTAQANANRNLGNFMEASASSQKALQIDPANVMAHQLLEALVDSVPRREQTEIRTTIEAAKSRLDASQIRILNQSTTTLQRTNVSGG